MSVEEETCNKHQLKSLNTPFKDYCGHFIGQA